MHLIGPHSREGRGVVGNYYQQFNTKTKMEKTLGEQRVRTDFNASNDDGVAQLKIAHAALINAVKAISDESSDPEVKRLCSLSMTDLENSAMWAVKAATAKK